MSIIYSSALNENYTVCCAGQLVYVYDKSGRELSRFPIKNAAFAVISPEGDSFAVKTTDGGVCMFSFEPTEQTGILTAGAGEAEYETGICYSPDGKALYCVETEENGSSISAYYQNGRKETSPLDGVQLTHIEYENGLLVLGKEDENFFAARFESDRLTDVKYISSEKYELYYNYKCAQVRGFTVMAVENFLPENFDYENNVLSISSLLKEG